MPAEMCPRVPPAHPLLGVWRQQQDDQLPLDPRSWCRADVAAWVSRAGGLPERFPMNGKALCLMSKDMFCQRVPQKGHELYLDFRSRLTRALLLQEYLEKFNTK